ncbi:lysophospholipase L1-like esterase [Arcticibacter pallidicorallinus]|uniref:Lysophospholipase L1-like esterase n=1 Tax=Arcticibacter pallidicorallinus TaxID=1259464 RepID=A0A2T0UBS6_9SPHI|nr:rhamnogalacturonan acetylesterase [Arcticibacter pallidicorallinus]PRY55344.1 lysophospholipase L1-like esterase [Arcticibacter pallidicorallinus]
MPLYWRLPFMLVVVLTSLAFTFSQRPALYIIGDSTVRNTNDSFMGWGTAIQSLFDTTRIDLRNQAMAGRSTRTFVKEGRWSAVSSQLKPGDYVMMQFGHNEGSKPDTTRGGYRGVLRGIGEETKELIWPDGTPETVHTYGWYIRQFIRDTKSKGATPIVLSMIPRNSWKEGMIVRADQDFGLWASQVAEQEGAYFIDLNKITADRYQKMGPDKVKQLFPTDHTHTNSKGALINAESVMKGLKKQKQIGLHSFLK